MSYAGDYIDLQDLNKRAWTRQNGAELKRKNTIEKWHRCRKQLDQIHQCICWSIFSLNRIRKCFLQTVWVPDREWQQYIPAWSSIWRHVVGLSDEEEENTTAVLRWGTVTCVLQRESFACAFLQKCKLLPMNVESFCGTERNQLTSRPRKQIVLKHKAPKQSMGSWVWCSGTEEKNPKFNFN